jgi:ribosomal-protein-alanine N-acetyltransferase
VRIARGRLVAKLETERLALRPIVLDDAAALVELFEGDWDAIKQTGRMPYPPTELALRNWLAGHAGPLSHSFLITLRGDGQAIGVVGFGGEAGAAELGYALGRRFWSKGYATEAVRAAVDLAREVGVRRLDAYSFIENPASARVLEKTGFSDLGVAARDYPKRGGARRVHHYRMTFEEG